MSAATSGGDPTTMTAKTMAEVIREELRKGGYQMLGDTLPYETQANAIAAHLTAAGFGLVADAKREALEEAAQAWWLRDDVRDRFGAWSWLLDRATG